jgi:hypothetical protein
MMRGQLRTAVWSLRISLGALLLSVAATTLQAREAPATAAEPPLDELVELNEVWVRGTKLARRVADAEDRLFKAYNKVNRNNIYDVHCGFLKLQPDSMIMSRTCLPGYLSDINYASNFRGASAGLGLGIGMGMGMGMAPAGACNYSGLYYDAACSVAGLPARYSSFNSPIGRRAHMDVEMDSVPPSVLAGYRREAYAQNVLDVITNDEQLTAMATELVKLYDEMELVRNRYTSMRAAAGPDGQKLRRHSGKSPRN